MGTIKNVIIYMQINVIDVIDTKFLIFVTKEFEKRSRDETSVRYSEIEHRQNITFRVFDLWGCIVLFFVLFSLIHILLSVIPYINIKFMVYPKY